jgi:hypothetical protein
LQGKHVVVAQQGNKIDSLDEAIKGSVQGNTAAVQFQSSFAADAGTAQITLVDANTISWKVTAPPGGEYYLPVEATLTEKSPAANPSPAQTGTIKEQGSGLGLIICKEMVERNKGKIWVESELSKGTTTAFTVPRTTQPQAEEQVKEEPSCPTPLPAAPGLPSPAAQAFPTPI